MRRCLLALSAAVLAVSLTACGGNDDDGDAGPATSPATSSTTTDETTGDLPIDPSEPTSTDPMPTLSTTPAPTEPSTTTLTPAPLPDSQQGEESTEWEAALRALLDTDTSAQERARQIVDGGDLAPTIRQVDARLAGYDVELSVTSTEIKGDRGQAAVRITSNGAPFSAVRGIGFARSAGAWHLTRDGACGLAAVANVSCPE